jgi:hypothetical protein
MIFVFRMTEQNLFCEGHDENKNSGFSERKTGFALTLQDLSLGINEVNPLLLTWPHPLLSPAPWRAGADKSRGVT